jgi:KDO2-lipid IV(A) lauroyltransferase
MRRFFLHLRWRLEWLLLSPIFVGVRLLSDSAVERLVAVAGTLAFSILGRDRRQCLANLKLVFGDNLSESGRVQLGRAVFQHHVRTFCEILRMTPAWIDRNVVVEGLDNPITSAAIRGGAILVSGHLGNFEISCAVLNRLGIPTTGLARPLDNPHLEGILASCRARYGCRSLPRDVRGLREAIRRLHHRESVGLAIDVNSGRRGIFVDFFGVPASRPRGAVELALSTGLPVIMVVVHREPTGTHRVLVAPPFRLIRSGCLETDLVLNLQAFIDALEGHIRDWPEQYHWQNGWWRTRPDGTEWTHGDVIAASEDRGGRLPYAPARCWSAECQCTLQQRVA